MFYPHGEAMRVWHLVPWHRLRFHVDATIGIPNLAEQDIPHVGVLAQDLKKAGGERRIFGVAQRDSALP